MKDLNAAVKVDLSSLIENLKKIRQDLDEERRRIDKALDVLLERVA